MQIPPDLVTKVLNLVTLPLKELLYKAARLNFEKGKMWECGMKIAKEKINKFLECTTRMYDYQKLSLLYGRISLYYKNIQESGQRMYGNYYRVAFWGRSFPPSIQNKVSFRTQILPNHNLVNFVQKPVEFQVFIYRGNIGEQLPDFVDRIQEQFPSAEVMKTLDNPSEEVRGQI